MVDQPSRRRRIVRRAALSVAGVVLLLGGYVSSYAPALRLAYDSPISPGMIEVGMFGVYRPVEWLIDETPLRGPLYAWAEWWGADVYHQFEKEFRTAGMNLEFSCGIVTGSD